MECVKFDGRRLENGNSGKTYCILRNFFLYFVLVIVGAAPSWKIYSRFGRKILVTKIMLCDLAQPFSFRWASPDIWLACVARSFS